MVPAHRQLANQSWLLSLSLWVFYLLAMVRMVPVDTRDNQLDELNSQVLSGGSIGAAPNSPDSLSGAVVQTLILFHVLRALFQIRSLL